MIQDGNKRNRECFFITCCVFSPQERRVAKRKLATQHTFDEFQTEGSRGNQHSTVRTRCARIFSFTHSDFSRPKAVTIKCEVTEKYIENQFLRDPPTNEKPNSLLRNLRIVSHVGNRTLDTRTRKYLENRLRQYQTMSSNFFHDFHDSASVDNKPISVKVPELVSQSTTTNSRLQQTNVTRNRRVLQFYFCSSSWR